MLFDLRGRGRRRVVQVIYLTLALLMGGGLVLFGIGGDVQGGLFDAFREEGDRDAGTSALQQRVERAEQRTRANPDDAAAFAQLAALRYQLATGEGFNQAEQTFTAAGKRRLAGAERAWDRYLALDPKPPDDTVAIQMVQAFSSTGLNKPAKAVNAMEIVIEQRPNRSRLYAQLADLAYQAGQTRKAELAADKAVELADPEDRKLLREQLDTLKDPRTSGAAAGTQPQP